LAYCTKGRNIHYLIADQLIETKKPGQLVLEITEYETTSSHKDFSLLAEKDQLFNSFSLTNFDYVEDLADGLKSRFYFNRNKLKNTNQFEPPTNYNSNFNYTPFHFTADSNQLNKNIKDNSKRYKRKANSIFQEISYSAAEHYVAEIAELCKKNNIELFLLYLPSIGNGGEKPINMDFYTSLAEVLIPPTSLYEDKSLWVDGEHFNYEGSKKLSLWVSKQLDQRNE
jgi:hypothetical protein